MEWLDRQWNRPSRDNWYMMQVASEIANLFRSKSAKEPKDFKIPFETIKPKAPISQEEKLKQEKSIWKSLLGIK